MTVIKKMIDYFTINLVVIQITNHYLMNSMVDFQFLFQIIEVVMAMDCEIRYQIIVIMPSFIPTYSKSRFNVVKKVTAM